MASCLRSISLHFRGASAFLEIPPPPNNASAQKGCMHNPHHLTKSIQFNDLRKKPQIDIVRRRSVLKQKSATLPHWHHFGAQRNPDQASRTTPSESVAHAACLDMHQRLDRCARYTFACRNHRVGSLSDPGHCSASGQETSGHDSVPFREFPFDRPYPRSRRLSPFQQFRQR